MFVDGASNSRESGAGVVLISPDGIMHEHSLRLSFNASNNEAEYEALIAGLGLAQALQIGNLEVSSDSQLVVNQVKGDYECRDE